MLSNMDFQLQVTETQLRQTLHKREFLDPLTEKPKRDLVPGLSIYPRLLSVSWLNCLLPARLTPAAGKRVEVVPNCSKWLLPPA